MFDSLKAQETDISKESNSYKGYPWGQEDLR